LCAALSVQASLIKFVESEHKGRKSKVSLIVNIVNIVVPRNPKVVVMTCAKLAQLRYKILSTSKYYKSELLTDVEYKCIMYRIIQNSLS